MVLTVPVGCKATYAQAMERVVAGVRLEDVGITEGVSFGRAQTGALMMRVRGEGGRGKVTALAGRMREALAWSGVLVNTPARKAEIRLRGLDTCSTPESVRAALAHTWAKCVHQEEASRR